MVVLRYFDPLNFAQDIRCPSLVGLSRKDPEGRGGATGNRPCDGGAPAGSVRADVVPDKPQRLARGQAWTEFEKRFLDLTLYGLPEAFRRDDASPPSPPPRGQLPAPTSETGA